MTTPSLRKTELTRPVAWACLTSNLLVLPGLGSITAGRRVSGYFQAVLGLIGFALTTGWCALVVVQWIRQGQWPHSLGPYGWAGLAGILLFGIAWSWALASSLAILRQAYAQPEPPPHVKS